MTPAEKRLALAVIRKWALCQGPPRPPTKPCDCGSCRRWERTIKEMKK